MNGVPIRSPSGASVPHYATIHRAAMDCGKILIYSRAKYKNIPAGRRRMRDAVTHEDSEISISLSVSDRLIYLPQLINLFMRSLVNLMKHPRIGIHQHPEAMAVRWFPIAIVFIFGYDDE